MNLPTVPTPPNVVTADLARLAQAYGVATEFVDQSGHHVQVAVETVIGVLGSLGVDATTTSGIERGLEDAELAEWRRMVPPVFVTIAGQERRFWVHVPHGQQVSVEVVLEDGTQRSLQQLDHWVDPRVVDGVLTGEASFRVPADLALGWHTVTATTCEHAVSAPLVVTPQRVSTDRIGQRQWGVMCQVYSVRSRQSWGVGDLHDASTLALWSADQGAGFLAINPLHAAQVGPPMTPSPYLPTSRRFTNPIYLHVEDIPEYQTLAEADRAVIDQLRTGAVQSGDGLLDRDACWRAKCAALAVVFGQSLSVDRATAFARYRDSEGMGLQDFATWMSIAEVHGPNWHTWPADLRDPRSPAVAEFRSAHTERIDWHCWLQWQMDSQLQRLQAEALQAGMAIGIVHDLAVGGHPDGADAWSLRRVLAQGVGVGAPPDMYNQAGQNWSQPPWRPDELAEEAFIPYRDMLRSVLRHAGGLRIDHALGLFRTWWIPDGAPAGAGTYVRSDHEALLGIACLEAERAGAVLIGEDLGTLEPWVQQVLADRGLLGTSILWFESDGAVDRPRDPMTWRRDVLASVTVHDLPPTSGYLRGEHVRLRSELGLLARPLEQEVASARAERQAWARLLVAHGWLPSWQVDLADEASMAAMVLALHRALAASPARLIGISLADLVGDRRAQNQPGTDQEYPNWRLPLADAHGRPILLEELLTAPEPTSDAVGLPARLLLSVVA